MAIETDTWVWYDPNTTYPMGATPQSGFATALIGHSIDLSTYTNDATWVDANDDEFIDDLDTRAPQNADSVVAPAGEGLEIDGEFQQVSSYAIFSASFVFQGESGDVGFQTQIQVYQLADGTVAFRFHDNEVEALIAAGRTPDDFTDITLTSLVRFEQGMVVSEHDTAFPCFAAGTLVDTAQGAARVEDLNCGDLVKTMDRGLVPIAWIGRRAVAVSGDERLRPVRIRKGALGDGLPSRDLWVSQQHRMLIRSRIVRRMFGTDEVLVPARLLLDLDGIEIDRSFAEITYVHFMCAGHEVVFAEGAPAESLYLGPEARKMLGEETLAEIFRLFPALREYAVNPQPARALVKGPRAKQLAFRHQKNSRAPLVA